MFRIRKAIALGTLFLWLFAIGHCVAECLHVHQEAAHHDQVGPHHHHSKQEDRSQHHHDDHGVPCEISSVLPWDLLQKVVAEINTFVAPSGGFYTSDLVLISTHATAEKVPEPDRLFNYLDRSKSTLIAPYCA